MCVQTTFVYILYVVPIPLVQITVFHNKTFENETLRSVTVGDPLTLDCTVTAVRDQYL